MNNEKIQALFEAMVVVVDQQKIATQQLNNATEQAKRLKIENNKNDTISKVVKDFKAIQSNTAKLEKVSLDAVKKIESRTGGLRATTMISTIIGCATFGLLTGLIAGYIGFSSINDKILNDKLATIDTERAKIQELYAFVNDLKNKGFKIYTNAVVLPQEFSGKVGKTEDGQPAIFSEK